MAKAGQNISCCSFNLVEREVISKFGASCELNSLTL